MNVKLMYVDGTFLLEPVVRKSRQLLPRRQMTAGFNLQATHSRRPAFLNQTTLSGKTASGWLNTGVLKGKKDVQPT